MADDDRLFSKALEDSAVSENASMEEVFQCQLRCTREGMTAEQGKARIEIVGLNKLKEKKENKLLKFLGFMWNPLSLVMESAAIMAIIFTNFGDRSEPPDWQDFVGIVALLLNSTISSIEENNAGNAAAELMKSLASRAKVAIVIYDWSRQFCNLRRKLLKARIESAAKLKGLDIDNM